MQQANDTLLIVDDDDVQLSVFAAIFEEKGFRVRTAPNGQSALLLLKQVPISLLITDLKMPGMDGLALLQACRELNPDLEAIILTGHADAPSAFEAARLGALDYVQKPCDMDELARKIQQIATRRHELPAVSSAAPLREAAPAAAATGGNGEPAPALKPPALRRQIVGRSAKMMEVFRLTEKAANSRANVLIRGESGTGKELVARALHEASPRHANPFVPICCSALPEQLLESELFGFEKGSFTGAAYQKKGRFELADTGTLFLDEIGELPPALQVKLLRVLQEKEFERIGGTKSLRVDVRLIAATNTDLERAVAHAIFREDLYYRLRVIEIWLPPLRERMEDLQPLAHHLLKRYNQQNHKQLRALSSDAWELLHSHRWPGNVRELENALERAVVLADPEATVVTPDLLAPSLRACPSHASNGRSAEANFKPAEAESGSIFQEAVNSTERQLLLQALEETGGNLTKAAAKLGLSLRSVRYYMKKHALSKERWSAQISL